MTVNTKASHALAVAIVLVCALIGGGAVVRIVTADEPVTMTNMCQAIVDYVDGSITVKQMRAVPGLEHLGTATDVAPEVLQANLEHSADQCRADGGRHACESTTALAFTAWQQWKDGGGDEATYNRINQTASDTCVTDFAPTADGYR